MILDCKMIVECDECGEEEGITLNADNNGVGDIELKRALRECGWVIDTQRRGAPKMLCDNCKDKADEE